jgi:c(7)-type cytochrome triheme protein
MRLTGAMKARHHFFSGLAAAFILNIILLPACGTTEGPSLTAGADAELTGLDPAGRTWDPVSKDGLHDPESTGTYALQLPSKGLTTMPLGEGGNQVDWVMALDEGYIFPKGSLDPDKKDEVLDLDVLLKETGEMPMITFPHIKHTLWLGCENCHDHLFVRKAGATPGLNMYAVLSGEKCGLCHGAVAFPPSDCIRCHNTPRANESVKHKRLR